MTIIILFFPAHQRLIFIYHQNPQPALNYEGGKEERRREGERRGGPGAAAAAAAASASVFKSHLITALPLMDTPDCCWVLYLQEAQAHVSSQLYLLFMVITIEWLRRLQLIALCWGLRPRRRGGEGGGGIHRGSQKRLSVLLRVDRGYSHRYLRLALLARENVKLIRVGLNYQLKSPLSRIRERR